MKKYLFSFYYAFVLLTVGAISSAFYVRSEQASPAVHFPYSQAGLTEREAAAHLLSRFSFGARPGEIDAVVKMGLETWVEQQLAGGQADPKTEEALASFASLKMTNEEIVKTYPRPGQVLRMAVQEGVLDRDSAKLDKKESRKELKELLDRKGLKTQQELLRELGAQKVLRAAYSANQLQEVLTDFWYNHFNVAASKGGVQQYITTYERDVIRPNVTGRFETLLLATAKSPAMLVYLDNNRSTVNAESMDAQQKKAVVIRDRSIENFQDRVLANMTDTAAARNAKGKIKKPKMEGLNENYAREIMELHTLGVDGGYTQSDVTQAARILTGWTLNPVVEYGLRPKQLPAERRLQKMGIVYDDNFLFAAQRHDKGEKKVLGTTFPAGGGYAEGEQLLHLLATHPSTAKFISRKLAVRFVSDVPPQSLVDKMAKTFLDKGGDIKQVLLTMVSAPEFWSKASLREKTKSPFEVAISSIRATNAEVMAPLQVYQWVTKMGQQLYNYQAPTGFPDRGQYWINTGSLLARMNFGLAFASGRIPGVKVDLLALNNGHEPESAEAALRTYAKILLPERSVDETVKRLTPMLSDPDLQQKIDVAAGKTDSYRRAAEDSEGDGSMMEGKERKGEKKIAGKKANNAPQPAMAKGNNSMLGQVVGIVIGSPEFQRR